jgi:hypothetical protein
VEVYVFQVDVSSGPDGADPDDDGGRTADSPADAAAADRATDGGETTVEGATAAGEQAPAATTANPATAAIFSEMFIWGALNTVHLAAPMRSRPAGIGRHSAERRRFRRICFV